MSQVFISYSRRDLVFVERLAKDLKAAGLEVWYDLSNLEVGSRWEREIQNVIRQSQYFVIVLSPNSIESDWVDGEFLYASNLKKLKIIPLLYKACDLPIRFVGRHYIDVQGEKYRENFDQLLKALGVEKPAAPKSVVPSLNQKKEVPQRTESVSQPGLRRWRVLVGVMLLIVLLVPGYIWGGSQIYAAIFSTKTPTPMPTPISTATPAVYLYDGNWVGMTSQNYRFAFTITHNAITSISGTAAANSVSGICPIKIESLVDVPIYHPLVNDNLSINYAGDLMTLTLNGTFTSGISASGNLYIEATEDCKRSAQVTWTASKQSGTPTPIASTDPAFANAHDHISYIAPLYKTSFDYWGNSWEPSGNTKIENGIVIASSGSGFTGARARVLTASRFAYTFDFRNPDSNPNHGPCETLTTNGLFETTYWKGFDVLFHHNGYVELGRNIWPGNFESIAMSSNRFDFSKFNTVTVIVLDNQIGVFVNGQAALTMIDPKGATVYTEQDLGGYSYALCEFDNFKLWDLTGLSP